MIRRKRFGKLGPGLRIKRFEVHPSVDDQPWRHPFLNHANISLFRTYSEEVWKIAMEYAANHHDRLNVAFCVNMAQNMHKWCAMARRQGASGDLFTHPWDKSAINDPKWEEFDGDYPDVLDGENFVKTHDSIKLDVAAYQIPLDAMGLEPALHLAKNGKRSTLRKAIKHLPSMRWQAVVDEPQFSIYLRWAHELWRYHTAYAASVPIAAYLSDIPYAVCAVGGDLQVDCGRADELGWMMLRSFASARFLMISNPHVLGHSRRLGLNNGVYLPYPMDSHRYSPGAGKSRADWEARLGKGTFVLSVSRIDSAVKGQGYDVLLAVTRAMKEEPSLKFVVLGWGASIMEFKKTVSVLGLKERFLFLPPAGKKRLIDYYRSCDLVMEHFVYGYYGATTLEAASIGKPVVIKLREGHYRPLYAGDVAPVENVDGPQEIYRVLIHLARDSSYRHEKGEAMRAWLVRNHGEEKTGPLMMALLRLVADKVPLPKDLLNPLQTELGPEEKEYHRKCLEGLPS